MPINKLGLCTSFHQGTPSTSASARWLRQGSAALISVFVIAFLFGGQPNESHAGIVPAASKNAPTFYPKIVGVGQDTYKITFSKSRCATFNADPASAGKFNRETNLGGELVLQFLRLAPGEGSLSKIVMISGQEWPQPSSFLYKLCKNPTFNSFCSRAAEIDQCVVNDFSNQIAAARISSSG